MPVGQTKLDEFYDTIAAEFRRQKIPCAITGGLACVRFGVAQHTEDCDLICAPEFAQTLLRVLESSRFGSARCEYRKTSPPLDQRWLAGGYTAHFLWRTEAPEKPFLDVFGVPPRVSTRWEKETVGLFASRHTVAEMKRTHRRKDWDQATALGLAMLEKNDQRGWLHVFDATILRRLTVTRSPAEEQLQQRPVLQLAKSESPLLDRAVQTEVEFWTHLDALRLKVYEMAHENYGRALLRSAKQFPRDLLGQHQARVELAERLLPAHPLADYGIPRLIQEARAATAIGLDPEILRFLPDVMLHFENTGDHGK